MLNLANLILGIPGPYFGFFFLALVVSAIGFRRLVYFISIGYGFSIAAMGLVSVFLFSSSLTWLSLVHVLLLTTYGLRLGGYLTYREFQASYQSDQEEVGRSEGMGLPVKAAIWITVSILYTTMFAPALFHIYGAAGRTPVVSMAGVAVTALGLFLETLADSQKNRAKKKAPDRFVSNGLFRMVRQPNYFGEILVWTGSFVAGIPFYQRLSWWIIAAAGWLCIFLIMLGSAKRLELKQEKRYGSLEEFQAYARRTPLLFPLLPIYSLKNWKIVLG